MAAVVTRAAFWTCVQVGFLAYPAAWLCVFLRVVREGKDPSRDRMVWLREWVANQMGSGEPEPSWGCAEEASTWALGKACVLSTAFI